MIRQHDAARADPNRFRSAGDVSNYDRGRRARDTRQIMMLRQPVAMISPFFGVLREIERVSKRRERIATFEDRRKIENGIRFHL